MFPRFNFNLREFSSKVHFKKSVFTVEEEQMDSFARAGLMPIHTPQAAERSTKHFGESIVDDLSSLSLPDLGSYELDKDPLCSPKEPKLFPTELYRSEILANDELKY
ncbi:hypothetical protein NQZ68_014767 [Dissostichus eleginoides]|nr:hypothetical protein NQZ68_014767 [Dissostichus eleginoides]